MSLQTDGRNADSEQDEFFREWIWRMTLPGGSNPADVLFKLAKGRGLANPTFEQVIS